MFIIPSDYNFQVRTEIKNFIRGENDSSLRIAESAALSQIKSYLNARYQVSEIFIDLQAFNPAIPYTAGQYCFYAVDDTDETQYRVYKCIADTTNETPQDNQYWETDDPRNFLIVMLTIDLVVYHLYAAFARSEVPAHRKERYNEALEWLTGVSEAKIEADLPFKVSEDGSSPLHRFRWGSHPRESHRY